MFLNVDTCLLCDTKPTGSLCLAQTSHKPHLCPLSTPMLIAHPNKIEHD